MTTQEARPTCPKVAAIAGSAVATMVWSTTARNIGSMIDGNTRKNRLWLDPAAPTATEAGGDGSGGTMGCGLSAWDFAGRAGERHRTVAEPTPGLHRLGVVRVRYGTFANRGLDRTKLGRMLIPKDAAMTADRLNVRALAEDVFGSSQSADRW